MAAATPATADAIRQDKRDHGLAIADRARRAAGCVDTYIVYKTLLLFKRTFPPPAAAPKSHEGEPLATDYARAVAYAAHFASLQEGVPATPGHLDKGIDGHEPFAPPTHSLIPRTRYDTAIALRSLAPRKAPGHDGIPTDLLKAYPHRFVDLLHPLLSKVIHTGQDPAKWP